MKEIICGIYQILNTVNGKSYIGQSVNIYSRWAGHKRSLQNNKARNIHLQRAWNEYKEESFEFRILECCEESLLDEREIYFIALYDAKNNGYNIESGGNAHKHLAQETRDKIRDAHLGKELSQETKDKMSKSRMGDKNPMFGQHHTQETKDFISQNNKGKTGHPVSELQRERARIANTGKIMSQETRDKIASTKIGTTPYNKDLRSVYCIELDKFFENATTAGIELNIRGENISLCCRNIRKSAGKHSITGEKLHWKYANEITNHCESNELAM